MFRPRTVLRLVIYVGLSWLVLAVLYTSLPSFSPNDNGTTYATKVLKSGGKLTRVYGINDYFDRDAVDVPSNQERRRFLALTFQMEGPSGDLVISGTGKVSLTKPQNLTMVQQQQEKDEGFILATEAIVVSAPAGDTDGISLPWFDTADAVLMFHFLQRDKALVRLRAVWKDDDKTVEVWSDRDGAITRNESPLISITTESETEKRFSAASVPPPPFSMSPSPTYHIRLTLLVILAPLTIGIMGIFFGIRFVVSAVFSFLYRFFWLFVVALLVRWYYRGKPPVGEFVQEVVDDGKTVVERSRDGISRMLRHGKEQGPSIHEDGPSSESAEKM